MSIETVWPSGLRRQLQALVRQGRGFESLSSHFLSLLSYKSGDNIIRDARHQKNYDVNLYKQIYLLLFTYSIKYTYKKELQIKRIRIETELNCIGGGNRQASKYYTLKNFSLQIQMFERL